MGSFVVESKPWYQVAQPPVPSEAQQIKDTRRKTFDDPLLAMKQYVKEKKTIEEQKKVP